MHLKSCCSLESLDNQGLTVCHFGLFLVEWHLYRTSIQLANRIGEHHLRSTFDLQRRENGFLTCACWKTGLTEVLLIEVCDGGLRQAVLKEGKHHVEDVPLAGMLILCVR